MLALVVASLSLVPGLNLIPWPQNFKPEKGSLNLGKAVTISCAQPELAATAKVLAEEVETAYGANWKLGDKNAKIVLQTDPTLGPDSYGIRVDDRVTIWGGNAAAVAMGTATLLQALEPNLSLPKFAATDFGAQSPYRGLMIDVARKYHSISVLKQCVELCRLYKLRYLQLHLTDDQAFTFPSRAFPKLTTVNQHGGPSYTWDELTELVSYAEARGVVIVPEMDVPGHSAALIRAMPELFKITGTQPYEHHATINFAKPEVMAAVETLIDEMCQVFRTSPYFHMGGDEADYSLADQNPDFQTAFKRLNLEGKAQHELYRRFISEVNDRVKKRNKQLIVWEGFGQEPNARFQIPKDVLVMEFESAYYLPTDLLHDGYTLINAAWTPLYVVNQHVWPAKKVYEWDRRKFGRFSNLYPTTTWFEAPTSKGIIGAQVCSWEGPEWLEITNLRRMVPAMAERIWNPNAGLTYEDFARRLTHTDDLLGKLIEPVQITAGGLSQNGPDEFDIPRFAKTAKITLKARRPGDLRYTLDPLAKPETWKPYQGPLTLTETTTIRAAVFHREGKRGLDTSQTFYFVPPKTPNLATGKKVTVSGGTQAPQNPELAVDDNLDLTSSWWASPAPQWLQVDLGANHQVDRIQVYPYWDGRRYYQYVVSVSQDGQTWTEVADRRTNTTPASNQGDEIKFPARAIRYVRVTMLKNSANEGVHLVELKVWPTKS